MPARDSVAAGGQDDHVLGLVVEWYDPQPQLIRQFILKFFIKTHEVEMVDRKSRRLFLKKTACPEYVGVKDLYVGNRLNLFARILTIVDYADPCTKKLLQPSQQRGLMLVTPDALHMLGRILDAVMGSHTTDQPLQLAKLRMVRLTQLQAEDVANLLCSDTCNNTARTYLPHLASSGSVVAALFTGEDCINRLTKIGEEQRKLYSAGEREPALLCAESDEQIGSLIKYLFEGAKLRPTATFDSCTCCVIRPHAVRDGHVGKILDIIASQGYEISALQTFNMDLASAQEFLEVYKGVVPEFGDIAEELTEGPVVALELRAEDAVKTFRATAGPWDVEVAKELRPKTIRAQFGIDRVRTAVHCTDLPEDGESECRYFFELLAEEQGHRRS